MTGSLISPNTGKVILRNLAGGGVPNTENPKEGALVEGDANLYTQPWPPIHLLPFLDHWFGPGGLGLNKNQFLYWSMDNEPISGMEPMMM
jgi:hypothetical protein